MIPRMARLSRRSVVGVAAVGAVSGCSGGGSGRSADGAQEPAPGTVERALAARDSLALLGQYDATLAAHPQLAGRLAPLRAQVAQHVTAFGGRLPAPTAAAGGPGTSTAPPTTRPARDASPGTAAPPAATPSAAPTSSDFPGPAASLAALAATERRLADRRAAALLTVPGELARLMASVAAAGAAHVVLLSPGAHTA